MKTLKKKWLCFPESPPQEILTLLQCVSTHSHPRLSFLTISSSVPLGELMSQHFFRVLPPLLWDFLLSHRQPLFKGWEWCFDAYPSAGNITSQWHPKAAITRHHQFKTHFNFRNVETVEKYECLWIDETLYL